MSYRRTYSTGRCAPELLVHVVTVVPNTTIRCEIMCLRMHTSYVKHVVLLCDCIWLLGAVHTPSVPSVGRRPHAASALCCDTARKIVTQWKQHPRLLSLISVNMSSIQYLVSPFNSVPAELREITLFRDLWRTVAACCRSNVASDRTSVAETLMTRSAWRLIPPAKLCRLMHNFYSPPNDLLPVDVRTYWYALGLRA